MAPSRSLGSSTPRNSGIPTNQNSFSNDGRRGSSANTRSGGNSDPNFSRSSGMNRGSGAMSTGGQAPPPGNSGRPNYGSGDYHSGGQHGQGHYPNNGGYYGGNYGGRYPGYPSFNQFYFGPGGFGYNYFGGGFGISVGLPLNRYYDYYNVAQPYYVETYPQPYYSEYVIPSGIPVGVQAGALIDGGGYVEPGLLAPTPAYPGNEIGVPGFGASIIAAAGNAGEFQGQAELAFREHRYEDAARLSNHAIIEDRENGKLHLFASQVFFALGDYRSSAAGLQLAASLLDPAEWGFVVENYKQFYRGSDYVTQMAALVDFIKQNPEEPYAHFLRGYHYKYLGYDKEAQAPLLKAVELESRDRLAAELLVMAGGQLPASLAPAIPVPSDGKAVRETSGSTTSPTPAELNAPAKVNPDVPEAGKPDGPTKLESGEPTPAEPVDPNKVESSVLEPATSDAAPNSGTDKD